MKNVKKNVYTVRINIFGLSVIIVIVADVYIRAKAKMNMI